MRRMLATLTILALMVAMSAMPAMAAPVVTGGLVNVTIVDAVDVNDNTVQLPIAAAANVCDVDVNVLAADLADDGEANCTAEAGSRAQR
jgi:hypothetical protein